jgi:hypothetical protein
VIRLVMTCVACPEQYDAFDEDGRLVGYLRLRHGRFRVTFPDSRGEIIFSADPVGDGIFRDEERDGYLVQAVRAIRTKLGRSDDAYIITRECLMPTEAADTPVIASQPKGTP